MSLEPAETRRHDGRCPVCKKPVPVGTMHRVEVYPDTEHGFAFPQRPVYVKPAAERHWERMFSLFDRNLRR